MKEIKTAIVVLHYNKIRLTQRCIQSILDAGYTQEQIHCFDNGSKPEIFEELNAAFPQCAHQRIKTNLGFSGGFNRALTQVFSRGNNAALFCTNDTIMESKAMEACNSTAAQTGAGMVAPLISYLTGPDAVDSIGAWFDHSKGFLYHYHEKNLPQLLDPAKDYIPGTAVWINKKTFETLNGTDESFHMYWEDADLSFRAHQKGILQARCYDARFRHGVGQTNRKKPLYTTFYFHRNRIRFCKRYLQGENLKNVLALIRQELLDMGEKWKEKADVTRLDYLSRLMLELEQ